MNNEKSPVYRFGDYTVDTAGRELKHGGEPVVVQPRVYELLVYLIEHRDRAVDKDEIQDAVWPGTIVTETALTRAVMKARRAVGDDAGTQSVIKTLHGHGYRFVAPVSQVDEAGVTPEPVSVAAGEDVPAASRGPRLWFFAAGLAVVAGVAWLTLWSPVSQSAGARVAVLPVINATGDANFDWARLGLMSFTSGLIESAGALPVVPDARVVGLTDSFEWNGELDSESSSPLIDRLRRAYGASHVVSMRLESGGGNLRMTYAILDSEGATTVGTMVDEEGTELARGVVRSVVTNVSGRRRMAENQTSISDDPFVNEAYSRGKSFRLQGLCDDARPLFKVAMDQEPALVQPRFEYAVCSRILGDWEEGEAILTALVGEQRPGGPTRDLAHSLAALGILYNRTGRLDEAHATQTEALEVARTVDDRDLAALALVNLAIVAEDRGEFATSRELLGRAIVAYREAGRENPPGQVYSGLANLAMDEGELDEADVYLGQALEAYRFVGDRRRVAMMINNTGFLRRLQGRTDEAEKYHLQSLEIREKIGDRVGVGRIRGMLAVVYLERGRFSDSKTSAEEALSVALETRDRLFEGTSLAQIANAELSLGDIDAAETRYRESRQVFVEIQDALRVLQVDARLAYIELKRGDLDAAEAMAARVADEAAAAELTQAEVDAMELHADVALERGDREEAVRRFAKTLERLRDLSWAAKETTISVKLAEVYLDLDDLESAEPLVGHVTEQPSDYPSLKLRARYAFKKGDRERAAQLMTEAQNDAGQRWTTDDDETLARYQDAAPGSEGG